MEKMHPAHYFSLPYKPVCEYIDEGFPYGVELGNIDVDDQKEITVTEFIKSDKRMQKIKETDRTNFCAKKCVKEGMTKEAKKRYGDLEN